MLNKTVNTMRSSASTSITTLAFSCDSFKSPSRKKSKERDDYSSCSNTDSDKNKRFINSEIILIRKEKTVDKQSPSKLDKRSSSNLKQNDRADGSKSPVKIQLNTKSNLKMLEASSLVQLNSMNEPSVRPILKKKSSFHIRIDKPIEEVAKSKSVKFVDADNFYMNEDNEEVEIPKRPLADIIRVESYRHYKIYAGSGDPTPAEDDSETKTMCRCACLVF
jgi:hypothetical protein